MYYKKCLNKINKFAISLCFMLAIMLTSFAGVNFHFPVYAADSVDRTSLISNADFSSDSVSTTNYVTSPTNWSEVNPNSLDISDNNSLFFGVMNPTTSLASTKSEDEYGLTNNQIPSEVSNNLLLLNSTQSSVSFGYQSSSFDLSANSYYKLTVNGKAIDGIGYIVINNLSSGEDTYLRVGADATSFRDYDFYFSTSTTSSETISISLLLGRDNNTSSGAVVFDYVKLSEYSQSRYNLESQGLSNGERVRIVNLRNKNIDTIEDFEGTLSSWSDETKQPSFDINEPSTTLHIMGIREVSTQDTSLSALGISQPANTGNAGTKALLIYNSEDSYQTLRSSTKSLDINARYKLTIMAKSECAVGDGAKIVVGDTDTDTSANLSVSTSATENTTKNNWTEYTFYITTSSRKTNSIYIELSLGSSDDQTSGYVWFDDITLEKVSDTEITDNQSNSNTTTLSLETYTDGTISNYDFNKTSNQNSTTTYPLSPVDWTYTGDYEDASGVVNTNANTWTSHQNNYKNANNPGATPKQLQGYNQNHVLMIANNGATSSSYQSETFTLTASGYYTIQFEVQTQIPNALTNANQGVTLAITNSNSETIYKTSGISTDGWNTFKAYIHIGDTDQTCTVTLSLDNVMGYAFFDNIVAYSYTADDDGGCAIYDNDYNNDTGIVTKKIDLSTINFDNYDTNLVETSEVNAPYKWTGTLHSESNGVAPTVGIVKNATGKNVLQIKKVGLPIYYTYEYNNSISLTSGSYYQITLNITTANLNKDANTEADENGDYAYGVYINLNSIDQTINIKKDETHDYTFYIYASETTSSTLSVSLGGEDALTSGTVQINSVSISTIADSTEFDNLTANANVDYNVVVANTDTTSTDDTTDDEETSTFSASDINWLIIPSVILSLAIIIAVVGYSVRQIKIRRKPRIKTSYDRRKTIDVELNKQQRIEARKNIISDLQQEINEIDNEIAVIKAQFDAMEQQSTLSHTKLIEAFRVEKENVEKEHKQAIADYKESIRTLTDDKEKERSEKKFAKYINELQTREKVLALKMERKDENAEKIRARRDAQIARYIEQRMLIAQEIEKVQAEIEEIAREEQEVWSEYQKAKEEARQEKLKYIAEKRKYKQYQKEQKKLSKNKSAEKSKQDDQTDSEQE